MNKIARGGFAVLVAIFLYPVLVACAPGAPRLAAASVSGAVGVAGIWLGVRRGVVHVVISALLTVSGVVLAHAIGRDSDVSGLLVVSTALFAGYAVLLDRLAAPILALVALVLAGTVKGALLVLALALAGFTVGLITQFILQHLARPLSAVNQSHLILLLCFAVAGFALIVYFAAVYFAIQLKAPSAFVTPGAELSAARAAEFGDFLILSAVVMLGGDPIGYVPSSRLALAVYVAERVVSVFWFVIYIGLLLSTFDKKGAT